MRVAVDFVWRSVGVLRLDAGKLRFPDVTDVPGVYRFDLGNRVYIGCMSTTAEFYVLDLNSGTQVQLLTLDSAVTGSVAVGPDCLIVGTDKGAVYRLGAKK